MLKAQRFYPDGATDATVQAYGFVFDSCGSALKAYRERLPRLVELARALVIAELEIDGQYSPERHDAVFEAYGAAGLDAAELAVFPDYLVCIADGELDAQENARLMEILSSGLPIKVLLQVDDLTDSTSEPGMQAPGMRSRQLASLAMGLNEVYVLQSSASNLFQFRERLHKGVTLSRAGAVQRVLRREREGRGPAAVPDGRRRDGVARLPGFHLRPVRRRQLGRALLPAGQFAGGPRLAGQGLRLRGRAAPERDAGPRLHGGRFPRRATAATPASSRACRARSGTAA